MARATTITVEHEDTIEGVVSGSKHASLVALGNYFHAAAGGTHRATTLAVQPNQAVAQANATGTVTLATCAAGTVVEVNGVEFIAVSSDKDADLNEFDVSGSDTEDAASFVTTFNACTDARIAGVLTASSALGVVTITADQEGYLGNAVTIKTRGILASVACTCVSVVATDTLVINGTSITAKASGAVNNEFNVGATDAATATNLAAAINASTTALVSSAVYAYADSNIVRVRAKHPGLIGNAITSSSTGGTISVATARLAGGTVATAEGVQATGTITIAGADGGSYVATINGVDITVTGTNGNDTTTATTITAAINASTNALVRGIVYASSSSGVVTITAIRGGISGNQITLAATGTAATASVARLATGAAPITVVPSGERLASGTGGSADAISFTL